MDKVDGRRAKFLISIHRSNVRLVPIIIYLYYNRSHLRIVHIGCTTWYGSVLKTMQTSTLLLHTFSDLYWNWIARNEHYLKYEKSDFSTLLTMKCFMNSSSFFWLHKFFLYLGLNMSHDYWDKYCSRWTESSICQFLNNRGTFCPSQSYSRSLSHKGLFPEETKQKWWGE